jgi:hypothetical protein
VRARRLIVVLVCAALALVFAGCDARLSDEERAVQDAVRGYNDALVVAFAEMDMNRLQGTATEEQAGSDAVMMQSLGTGGVRMVATVRTIKFGEITFPADGTARVSTTETWDYRHENLETSQTVRTETGVVYHLAYDLVLQDGRWLVAAVTALDQEDGSEETTSP